MDSIASLPKQTSKTDTERQLVHERGHALGFLASIRRPVTPTPPPSRAGPPGPAYQMACWRYGAQEDLPVSAESSAGPSCDVWPHLHWPSSRSVLEIRHSNHENRSMRN